MWFTRDTNTRRQTQMETTKSLVDHVQYILAKAQLAGNMVLEGHEPTVEKNGMLKNAVFFVVRLHAGCKPAK